MPLFDPKTFEGGIHYWHYCPGCDDRHIVQTRTDGSGWDFNGDLESPTFSPSIKHTLSGGRICHYYIRDGRIEYCDDCYHDLAGTTVNMADVEPWPTEGDDEMESDNPPVETPEEGGGASPDDGHTTDHSDDSDGAVVVSLGESVGQVFEGLIKEMRTSANSFINRASTEDRPIIVETLAALTLLQAQAIAVSQDPAQLEKVRTNYRHAMATLTDIGLKYEVAAASEARRFADAAMQRLMTAAFNALLVAIV